MRLLNATTGRLEDFPASNVPKYAILSHTWGEDEVTFQDVQQFQSFSRLNPFGSGNPEAKPSYAKIRHARKQALDDGYHYLWADTICIDKSSSAELSEAINSMFRWYANAFICYAFLEDAPEGFPHKNFEEAEQDLTDLKGRKFVSCKWFTRGWTLQELLAPKSVTFYGGKDWRRMGTKFQLADWIVLATGIDRDTLLHPGQLRKISVARKMSWASNRATTRIEDVAYCLLGLFGVNMPLLYGEGENAFIRLQEEIMKLSDDQSLFAWKALSENSLAQAYGIFARSPKLFEDSGKVIPILSRRVTAPFIMTNRGLQIDLPLMALDHDHLEETDDKEYLGILDCQYEDDFSTCLAITLKQTHTSRVYVRLEGEESSLQKVSPQDAEKAVTETVFIPRNFIPFKRSYMNCQVKCRNLEQYGYVLVRARRPGERNQSRWNPETQLLRIEASDEDGDSSEFISHATFIFYNKKNSCGFAVRLDMQQAEVESRVRISRLRGKNLDFALVHFKMLEDQRRRCEKTWRPEITIESDSAGNDVALTMKGAGLEYSNRQRTGNRLPRSDSRAAAQRIVDVVDKYNLATSDPARSMLAVRKLRRTLVNTFDMQGLVETSLLDKLRSDYLNPLSDSQAIDVQMKIFLPDELNVLDDDPTCGFGALQSQYKDFTNKWYRLLDLDAEHSMLGDHFEHSQDLDDGSRASLSIRAELEQLSMFDQTLHILTIGMDCSKVFEMG